MLKYQWTYNEESETWETGECNKGCGVYYFQNEDDKWVWSGNAVVPLTGTCLGDYDTQLAAQQAAEEEFDRLMLAHGYTTVE